jgi:signal transduction histidine kinase
VAALLMFDSYQDAHRAAAAHAAAAELAVTRIHGLEWQVIAQGRVTPAVMVHAGNLYTETRQHLTAAEGREGRAGRALGSYAAAIHQEAHLIGAGRQDAARLVHATRADPAYRELTSALAVLVTRNNQAATHAGTLSLTGAITAVIMGSSILAMLLLRYGMARRALATAEVEQRMLRESDQAKNEMISVVSHDLRTPLTSVIGYLEMVTDEEAGPLTPEQRKFLAIVLRNTERLRTIVNDLLFISSARAGRVELHREVVDLGRAAADVVDAQQPAAAGKSITLGLSARPSPPVLADRHRVAELLENLLSNALKFTSAGGSVRVAVHPADDRVRLEVSDTGIGIAAGVLPGLFDSFAQADTSTTRRFGGTGLGLAISRQLVELMTRTRPASASRAAPAKAPPSGWSSRSPSPSRPLTRCSAPGGRHR